MRSTSTPEWSATGRAYTRDGTANSWPRKRASTRSSRLATERAVHTPMSPNKIATRKAILAVGLRSQAFSTPTG